jgi:hypothetical protein
MLLRVRVCGVQVDGGLAPSFPAASFPPPHRATGNKDDCIRCMQLAKASSRPLGGKLISVEAFIMRRIASSALDTHAGLQTPTGGLVAWELLYLWNSVPMITESTLGAMVQVCAARRRLTSVRLLRLRKQAVFECADTAQAADDALCAAESDDERAVPLLLRGAALCRLGFYADSMTSLQAAIELEGKLLHDTYVPPFALYEMGALHCAQGRAEAAKKVFETCTAVSYDFNFEVQARDAGVRDAMLDTFAQVRFRMRLAGASAWMEQAK